LSPAEADDLLHLAAHKQENPSNRKTNRFKAGNRFCIRPEETSVANLLVGKANSTMQCLLVYSIGKEIHTAFVEDESLPLCSHVIVPYSEPK
jgi:hypothetical protein